MNQCLFDREYTTRRNHHPMGQCDMIEVTGRHCAIQIITSFAKFYWLLTPNQMNDGR